MTSLVAVAAAVAGVHLEAVSAVQAQKISRGGPEVRAHLQARLGELPGGVA